MPREKVFNDQLNDFAYEPVDSTRALGAPNDFASPEISIATYKMRCPTCQKLYSVQAEQLKGANGPLKFQCVSCQSPFQAKLMLNGKVDFVEVSAVTAVAEPVVVPSIEAPTNVAPFVTRARGAIEKVPITVSELRCPKCGSRNVLSATDCRFCGVVFSKVKRNPDIESDPGLAAHPQLIELWEAALSNYVEVPRHEAFVEACANAQYLQFAGLKYSRLLSVTPQDEIARSMKNRVIALASYKTDAARMSKPKPFRIPSINNIMLGTGGGLMMIGTVLPTVRNLAGVGFAAMVLGIGVRFFMRPQH